MNESERPSTPATPESVWKSINGKEEASMDITFTPDQLSAMARSSERESIWSRCILLMLLIGFAGAFAYNVFSANQLWVRLSQGWLLAWTCLLVWRFRRGPRGMSAAANCASFLRHEFEGKRMGLLEIRRYMFLLVPSILASWWGGGPAIRLRALGVDPSSRLYEFASGPWPFIITGVLLITVWLAFGLAAKKATRELDELRRRTQQ
jgi:hypothetical protein